MVERMCLNCSHWEADFFEESHQEIAGYCSVDERVRLKYESNQCSKHRFKKGMKADGKSESGTS